MNWKHTVSITVLVLCVAALACKGSPPTTETPPGPGEAALNTTAAEPTLLQDRPLCGLAAVESGARLRQYWRSAGAGGVNALLKDDEWLWVGTPQGVVQLDLQTLDCTLWERTDTSPDLSLAPVLSLVRGPEGGIWAGTAQGLARYCADAPGEEMGWQTLLVDRYVFRLAFDADGDLWTFAPAGRGAPIVFRYDGHAPPASDAWAGEQLFYQDIPSDDCENWLTRDWFSKDDFVRGRDRFGSPQECRELVVWRRRLASRELPVGLELVQPLSPFAADEERAWLFAVQNRPSAEQPERYALLRVSQDQARGDEWSSLPWPLATLSSDAVMVADEGRDGVWIGTQDGLVFSDGQSVQRMPLTAADLVPAGPIVFGLSKDKAGRLWAATNQGLFRFDEASDRWQATEIGESALITPDDQGGLWAVSYGINGRVSHFDGQEWRHWSGDWSCGPKDVAADAGGGLWMTSFDCELLGFDGQRWAPYGGGSDIRGAWLDRGPDGALYAALRDDRVQRYDGAAWEVLPAPEPFRYLPVEALAVDHRAGVWLGYSSVPYLRYFDGRQWREFSEFVKEPARVLLVDSQDGLWVGGGNALLHYDGQSWEEIPVGSSIVALAEDRQGRIWAGGPGGLYAYDAGKESFSGKSIR